jgi:cellulose synthase/poly-beta-1,6-N-acetylglucosamine synthase-like glycosyltransferase
MSVILRGEIVAYNAKAIYYDEQPISFRQSLRQRVRWMKGTLQVSRYYGLEMFKQSIRQKRISMLDMGMFIFPWIILIVVRIFIGCAFCFLGFVSWESQISAFGLVLFGYIQGLLMVSIMTVAAVLVERKSLNATKRQLVLYLLLFPIYCVAYFPTALVALFSKPQWKPIYHGQSNRLDQKQSLKTQESHRD